MKIQKVRIFDEYKASLLQVSINDFIKDKKIIDIKYQTSHNHYSNSMMYSAMVIYEVEE